MLAPEIFSEGATAAVLAIIAAASFTRSTVGFGEALIAMPLLALVLPYEDAAAYVALVAAAVSVLILGQDWRSVRLRSISGLVLAAWAGIPLGFYLVETVPKPYVLAALAVVILLFVAQQTARPTAWRLGSDWPSLGFGFVAGVLGGAYNTQGPPVVIFGTLRGWSPREFRASIQGFALATLPAILGGHLAAGHITPRVLTLFLVSLPVLLAAVLGGRAVNRRIAAHRFVRVVHVLLLVIAFSLLAVALSDLI